MELLIKLGVFLILVTIGFFAGMWNERRHYRSILKREKRLADILVFSKGDPLLDDVSTSSHLVTGSAVISNDYFKAFLASIRKIVGGRISAYESLLDRARREAVLRMKESARRQNADMIFNVKFETAKIAMGGSGTTTVEVLAYGTAVAFRPGVLS